MAMEFIPDEGLTPFSPVAHDAASASVAVAAAAAAATSATDAATLVNSQAVRQKRLRTLARLADGIGRTRMLLPAMAATLPTIGVATVGSGIAVGTTWDPNIYPTRYSFLAADWATGGVGYPLNLSYAPVAAHLGNASDPSALPSQGTGTVIEFVTEAPAFEFYFLYGNTFGGFRIRCDGEIIFAGAKGQSGEGPANGTPMFVPVQWGDGSATYRKARHYQLELSSNGKFGGIRTINIYAPRANPRPARLKMLVHGDSMVSTGSDSGSWATSLFTIVPPVLGLLCDQPDTIPCGIGSTGFINDVGNTLSNFNDRVAIDVVARAPDVIIECGGRNDHLSGTQAEIQAAVLAWLTSVINAKPETIVFMTGPLVSYATDNASATLIKVRDAKLAAAASFPQNVAFIDNLAETWASGTGRQGATTGTGNSDWVIGPDATHLTFEGNIHVARQLASAMAKRIPALIAAQVP